MAKKYVLEDELLAAAQDGRREDIQRILDSGNVHVDCIDNNRNTSLIFAAACGHIEICKLLIIKGCHLNLQNDGGWTALMCAADRGHKDVCKLLISKEECDLDIKNEYGNNALLRAVGNDHTEIVSILMSKKIKLDMQNKDGDTALMWAAGCGQNEIVSLLIKRECQLNLQNKDGKTALIRAACYGNSQTAICLIEAGADIAVKNKEGKTAIDILKEKYPTKVDAVQAAIDARNVKDTTSVVNTESTQKQMSEKQVDYIETKQDEVVEVRKRQVSAKQADIDDIKKLFTSIGISCTDATKHAETLVLDHKINSKVKFDRKVGSDLAGFSAILQLDDDDVELLQEYFEKLRVTPFPPSPPPLVSDGGTAVARVVDSSSSSKKVKHWNCFMTHNWGLGNENHLKVKRINDAIQKQGVITWFDEERMSGETRQQMVEGIENSDIIVVFITDAYRNKINQGDSRDNCRFEFKHAFEQKGAELMIPVVMETGMRNAREWTGVLGAALSTHLYIDFSSSFNDDAVFDAKITELVNRITSLLP